MTIVKSFITSHISLFRIALGVLGIFAGAQITINTIPVPITLQTVVVLAIGLSYSPRESFLTLFSYIGLGAMGMPVFHSYRFGLSVLTGPTAGYILGMLMAAYAMSILREKYDIKSSIGIFGICLLGQLIIFTIGVSWLSYVIGFKQAFINGFLVFIPPGLAKVLLLTMIMRYIKSNN